ncbi:RloB family protein [Streptomyces sp. DSM 40750]|uniref:RloB family protein n=1 Tax=Streptomyces sp. DSM 40750 TaxID=2801030 RepID=UPI00214B4D38|nr:RloB family protein [Streptomyces sp. DSM 40750]UUU23821.1 RloB family protein [Streptomyces sp. DSM 40750]
MARTPKSSGGRRGPSFETSLRRTTGKREARRRLLIVCGAAVTESDYLRGLVADVVNLAVTVRVITKPCAPSQLVKYAVGQRDLGQGDFDEVWCVFDVDEFQDVRRAVDLAEEEGIDVAVSNPCFELWLILHFAPHTAYARTYRELLPHLTRHLPRYDKARLDFRHFSDGWRTAATRARQLAPRGKEHEANPASGVWALVERIVGRPAD